MNALWALAIILTVYAAYRVAQDIVRRSMRSYRTAAKVLVELKNEATALLERPLPPAVAKLVVALVHAAGCGCFVRGFVIAHYLPRGRLSAHGKAPAVEHAFFELDGQDKDIRDQFSKLLAFVIVYDSYRNPIQGWFFRRAVRAIRSQTLTGSDRMEANLTAFSVLSRKGSFA